MSKRRIYEEIKTATPSEIHIIRSYLFIVKHVHMIVHVPVFLTIKLLSIMGLFIRSK